MLLRDEFKIVVAVDFLVVDFVFCREMTFSFPKINVTRCCFVSSAMTLHFRSEEAFHDSQSYR